MIDASLSRRQDHLRLPKVYLAVQVKLLHLHLHKGTPPTAWQPSSHRLVWFDDADQQGVSLVSAIQASI